MEISTAKIICQCDSCKATLKKDEGDQDKFIKATLENGRGKNQDYFYCDEECLRTHLNARAKRNRSRASIIEIEFDIPAKLKATASLAKCSRCGTIANIATQPEICMGAVKCEKCGNPVTQATALETNPR